MNRRNTTESGFTIVELLIVVVVIAILAAISLIAYTGFQQRASNASMISSVNQVLKAISSYGVLHSAYPVTSNNQFCVVPAEDGSCTAHSANQRVRATGFDSNIATIATLPTFVPSGHEHYRGITANYVATRIVTGEPRPLTIQYSLKGEQQMCGIPNILNAAGDAFSTNGYTLSNSGFTVCVISIPGV